jgi:xylulose-5-phosphate/fructose-6-phosphate phosphoketolase
LIANVYLEGTYSEVYPRVTEDVAGLGRLFRQFSTPYGVPSHVSPPTPGSIHEGGELGYVLAHAFGAAFDNPDLVVVGSSATAKRRPLRSRVRGKGTSFSNPARATARLLPILQLNGYKISGPTVLGRAKDETIEACSRGTDDVRFVEGTSRAGSTRISRERSMPATNASARFRPRRENAAFEKGPDGRPSFSEHRKGGPVRESSTA